MNSKENFRRVLNRDNPQWVPYSIENEIMVVGPIVERPTICAGKDAWGVTWWLSDVNPESCTAPAPQDYVITDIERWEDQLHIPDIDSYDWTKLGSDFYERAPIDLSSIDRDNCVVTAALDMGVFERMSLLMGMEELLVNIVLEPEIIIEMADKIADYNVALIRKFASIFPFDMVRYGDDWGNQIQMMISPEDWRKIIKPTVKKIYDAAHECGMIVFQHSCGVIEPIIPDLIELGVDIWDPCQPCNNLKRIKQLYGDKMAFCGGIDSQFVLEKNNVTEEEVRAEVRKRIDEMGKGGGYFARPSHFIPYPQYVMDAMIDEIHKYGKYTG